jgi:hypothetical protein
MNAGHDGIARGYIFAAREINPRARSFSTWKQVSSALAQTSPPNVFRNPMHNSSQTHFQLGYKFIRQANFIFSPSPIGSE